MKAVVYGKNGELAKALASQLILRDWEVEMCSRTQQTPFWLRDAYFFPQGRFLSGPLKDAFTNDIHMTVQIGLTTIIERLHQCLMVEAAPETRVDYCIIGSTSAYQGAPNSSVYCAVKHGLHGLVNSLNKEYKGTNRRFWLASMGTMDTAMGRQIGLPQEDLLALAEVAERIVSAITHPSSLFEPDLIIRGRNQ